MVFQSYIPVLLFACLAMFISVAIVISPFLISRITGTAKPYAEKLSAYECGFNPADKSPRQFNIRFYIVAILFVIFDLEIAFLFPWSLTVKQIGIPGFISVMIFLFILTVGFVYEWKKGALDFR